ncbi:hypothetical protein NL676_023801 [Syzygium grande]|nr:hypothetical protein NL676_023801 [Syzygium grande]
MAISTLHKLSTTVHRLLSLSSFRPILAKSSFTLSHPLYSSSSSVKVSDRIVKLFAIDIDGYKCEIVAHIRQTLLKALTNSVLIDSTATSVRSLATSVRPS